MLKRAGKDLPTIPHSLGSATTQLFRFLLPFPITLSINHTHHRHNGKSTQHTGHFQELDCSHQWGIFVSPQYYFPLISKSIFAGFFFPLFSQHGPNSDQEVLSKSH